MNLYRVIQAIMPEDDHNRMGGRSIAAGSDIDPGTSMGKYCIDTNLSHLDTCLLGHLIWV